MDSYIEKHMDSYIQTKSDEYGFSCNHQKMFSELESKLFAAKQRFELLQTELKVTKFAATQEAENHKRECLNLKETISRLEVDRNQLREKEAKDQELIKTLFKMVEKYDKEFMEKLNEFMKKYGDENRSMYRRNDDIYVKKEFDGEMNDEMPNKKNDTMMISKKRVIREMWEKENCFAYGFTPFQLGNSAEEKGKNIHRQKKMPKLSDRRSNLIVSGIDLQTLGKRSNAYHKCGVHTGRTSNKEQRLNAIKRAENMQGNLNSVNPSFIKSMSPSHVAGTFYLPLNPEFCKKNLTDGTFNIILEDKSGLEFGVKYLGHDFALSGGWKGFAVAHKLELHDAIIFELCEPERFKVHIIKAIEELSEDSHDKIAKRLGTGTDGDQDVVDSTNIGKIQMEKHIQLGLDKS